MAFNWPVSSVGGFGYFAACTAANAAVSNIGLPLLVATLDSEATESCNLNWILVRPDILMFWAARGHTTAA
jgi:hypothetical protein